jgi:hypothetical protein
LLLIVAFVVRDDSFRFTQKKLTTPVDRHGHLSFHPMRV